METKTDTRTWYVREGWGTSHLFHRDQKRHVGHDRWLITLCGRDADPQLVSLAGPGSGDRCGQCQRRRGATMSEETAA